MLGNSPSLTLTPLPSSPIGDMEHVYWYRRGVLRSRNMHMLDTVELKLCIW